MLTEATFLFFTLLICSVFLFVYACISFYVTYDGSSAFIVLHAERPSCSLVREEWVIIYASGMAFEVGRPDLSL